MSTEPTPKMVHDLVEVSKAILDTLPGTQTQYSVESYGRHSFTVTIRKITSGERTT